MKKEGKVELLKALVEIQESSAPIKLSIGSVTERGIVSNGTIVIHNAPPIVVSKLIEYGYSIDVTENGIVIY